jgi:alpha-glucosidase
VGGWRQKLTHLLVPQKGFKFWLDKGVDGFRFSGVPYLFEDAELRDEPLSGYIGAHPDEADYLDHVYTQNLPETYDLIHEWRKILEEKKAEDGETR